MIIIENFGKLQINHEKLMNNEELLEIRGGYGWLTCRVNGVICWSASIDNCNDAREACNNLCGSWSEAICAG